jgi:transposase
VIRPGETVEVYLCREPVAMRRSIPGLSVLVEEGLGLDPFAKRLVVFCSRRRDKIGHRDLCRVLGSV